MNSFQDLSVLVTGGAGFIGSHLVEALVAVGARVTVLDNVSTGVKENLAAVYERIHFIQGDIVDKDVCMQAAKNTQVIFHLAAWISVPHSMQDPYGCFVVNNQGTLNMLEAAHQTGVSRFIFSSSSAVYGARTGRCDETMPCSPTSPYGLSKLIGELYCVHYAQLFGMHAVSLRYFNVYGLRQRTDSAYAAVVAKFTDQLQRNEPLVVFGTGQQTRDFVPVASVVQANMRLARYAHEYAGQVFNIASGTSISINALIAQLQKQHPESRSVVEYRPARAGDITHSQADCTKYFSVSDY